MGDLTIAADIIEGVVDIMEEVGATLNLRTIVYGDTDIDNPGAAPTETITNTPFEGFMFAIQDEYIDGTSILEGDQNIIVSIDGMTDEVIDAIAPGNYVLDGSKTYSIIRAVPVSVSGVKVVLIIQVRS